MCVGGGGCVEGGWESSKVNKVTVGSQVQSIIDLKLSGSGGKYESRLPD